MTSGVRLHGRGLAFRAERANSRSLPCTCVPFNGSNTSSCRGHHASFPERPKLAWSTKGMQHKNTLQTLRLPVLIGVFVVSTVVLFFSSRHASTLHAESLAIAKAKVLGDWALEDTEDDLDCANAYQLDPPLERSPYGAIVAAARSTENLSWMTSVERKYV